MAETSLDDVLSDAPPPKAPAPEPQEPAATEAAPTEKPQYQSRKQAHQDKEFAAQGLARDPGTGQFAKKTPDAAPQEQKPDAGASTVAAQPAPAAAAPVAEQMTAKEQAFLKAAQDERTKRQQLEQRLAALEANKPQEPAKTFWDDPEGALTAQRQEMQQMVTTTRLTTAEAIARGRHADFDEKITVFRDIAAQTPGLVEQMLGAPDPAEFAYRVGKNHQDLQAAGSIDGLKAQIQAETEARVRAQVEAELKAKYEAAAQQRAALPRSLSDVQGGATPQRPVWNGPTPLDKVLTG